MTQQPDLTYSLKRVERRYGDGNAIVNALAGIDLEVESGEFVVIAGPSGSGKTTLLQLLGALDRPTGGTILFEGTDIAARSENELADLRRERIGFVFQQFNLIPTLTARLNVEAALAPAGLGSEELKERALSLLDQVGLGNRADHIPTKLSGGGQNPGQSGAQRPGGIAAFASCMKQHGVDLPKPQAGSSGPPAGFDPTSTKFRAAMSACRSTMPSGGPPGGAPGGAPPSGFSPPTQ